MEGRAGGRRFSSTDLLLRRPAIAPGSTEPPLRRQGAADPPLRREVAGSGEEQERRRHPDEEEWRRWWGGAWRGNAGEGGARRQCRWGRDAESTPVGDGRGKAAAVGDGRGKAAAGMGVERWWWGRSAGRWRR
ncbi:hypothetical protein OsJ_09386 [Oryza sativa Japonica Group]|uniref:Uncharacterized protein n=2 Tax=Oryza sativa subsp. japonica TaxID=39947 RepID=A0A8J8XI84_ORYSJ|nr:hypothetical protein LOC_Os03g05130 [Oryza sativa Japonica Group]EAZ25560.1 hypothetical protein OsJ_09386 [Oryza sativa Japonica Group]